MLSHDDGPGQDALRRGRRQVNAALAEAVFGGLARRLDAGPPPQAASVKAAATPLRGSPDHETSISRATADEEAVRTQLAVATKTFAGIEG